MLFAAGDVVKVLLPRVEVRRLLAVVYGMPMIAAMSNATRIIYGSIYDVKTIEPGGLVRIALVGDVSDVLAPPEALCLSSGVLQLPYKVGSQVRITAPLECLQDIGVGDSRLHSVPLQVVSISGDTDRVNVTTHLNGTDRFSFWVRP